MRQSEKDVTSQIAVVSGFVRNPIFRVVLSRRSVTDDGRVKGADLALVRVENLKEFGQRRRLKVEAQIVFQSPFLPMNHVFRVEDARQQPVHVLLKIFQLGRQRAIEFLVEKEQIHEKVVTYNGLLLRHDQVEYLRGRDGKKGIN